MVKKVKSGIDAKLINHGLERVKKSPKKLWTATKETSPQLNLNPTRKITCPQNTTDYAGNWHVIKHGKTRMESTIQKFTIKLRRFWGSPVIPFIAQYQPAEQLPNINSAKWLSRELKPIKQTILTNHKKRRMRNLPPRQSNLGDEPGYTNKSVRDSILFIT